jgi:hypothetical protein
MADERRWIEIAGERRRLWRPRDLATFCSEQKYLPRTPIVIAEADRVRAIVAPGLVLAGVGLDHCGPAGMLK